MFLSGKGDPHGHHPLYEAIVLKARAVGLAGATVTRGVMGFGKHSILHTMMGRQLDEMSEKFEDIEYEQFGEDGFDDAVKQISSIESSLGLADISQFTAPSPPAMK